MGNSFPSVGDEFPIEGQVGWLIKMAGIERLNSGAFVLLKQLW